MLAFFGNFSDSFLIALLIWPFLAFALTLPILVIQYRKYNKIILRRGIGIYLFTLYCLALVSFTLYPMPSDPVAFCMNYHLAPQLNPLAFLTDIQSDGLRAMLQIIMNLVFFLPLGVFFRLLFRTRLRTLFASALAMSLFIETAQLTGGFGIYPCGYRLFDVDDLIVNTLGGVAGYILAMAIPRREVEVVDKTVIRQAGLVRHAVAFVIDAIVMMCVTIFSLVVLYFVVGNDATLSIREYIPALWIVCIYGVLPLCLKGWSFGGYLVRLNHDDRDRGVVARIAHYILRAGIAYLLIVPIENFEYLGPIMFVIILIIWLRFKKLPHQLI